MPQQNKKRKPNGYWTKERCHEVALKYTNRSEFQKNSRGAYKSALRNDWLDDICVHMKYKQLPNNYWNFEQCKKEALKFKSKIEFQKKSGSCYNKCLKNNWLENICGHMNKPISKVLKWTKNKCQEKAFLCASRSEFGKLYKSAYSAAIKNGFLDEICSHMAYIGNKFFRMVYAFEFSDNSTYIGLTMNKAKRFKDHLNGYKTKKSPVYLHMIKTGLQPVIKEISSYLPTTEAQILEFKTIEKYKNENWNILNSAKSGGLGGNNIKWTYEKCKEEARKYKTKIEFETNNASAYNISRKNKWLEDICKHMHILRKKWNLHEIEIEALKYENRKSFYLSSPSAYSFALRNNLLDKFCSHMKRPTRYKNKKNEK